MLIMSAKYVFTSPSANHLAIRSVRGHKKHETALINVIVTASGGPEQSESGLKTQNREQC
ncbi:hypothetical protein Mal48_11150 [Thalassoglobus polymorphus]|uniref:Uncharacterized protein n=1 Tax=Thalassoglobus polymorphus TaxID=2527994 RepID=A0A517QJQ7_9PLAN|nr:hypothetical protein Mal48_11150 [Thalassoglobus polymorphus]